MWRRKWKERQKAHPLGRLSGFFKQIKEENEIQIQWNGMDGWNGILSSWNCIFSNRNDDWLCACIYGLRQKRKCCSGESIEVNQVTNGTVFSEPKSTVSRRLISSFSYLFLIQAKVLTSFFTLMKRNGKNNNFAVCLKKKKNKENNDVIKKRISFDNAFDIFPFGQIHTPTTTLNE